MSKESRRERRESEVSVRELRVSNRLRLYALAAIGVAVLVLAMAILLTR